MPTRANYPTQIRNTPMVDVRGHGARCDGVTNDTAAVLAAIAALPAGRGTIYFPAGNCLLDPDTITTTGTVSVVGAGLRSTTLLPSGPGTVLWTISGIPGSEIDAVIRDFRIDLTTQPATHGIEANVLYGAEFARLWIEGGKDGMRLLTNVARCQLRDLFILNQTDHCIYVNGDSCAELRYDNLTLARVPAGTTNYGLRIHRTTTPDVGAHYMKGVHVLGWVSGGGVVSNGIAVTSTTATDTGTILMMEQVVVEQISGPALLLNKGSIILINNSWISATHATEPTIKFDGSDNVFVTNSNIINGSTGPLVEFVAGTQAATFPRFIGNRFAGTSYVFKVDAALPPLRLQQFGNTGITTANLTNDLTTFLDASTDGGSIFTGGLTIPSGGSGDSSTLKFEDLLAGGTLNATHIRQIGTSLQFLRGDFATTTASLNSTLGKWSCKLLAVDSLPVHANNAAAIAGGLVAGDFYRTGGDPDTVGVVH